MKNILTGLLFLLTMNAAAQEFNKKLEDPNRHKQVLINQCTREGLTSFPEFKESYDTFYGAYTPDSLTLKQIGNLPKDVKITVVLGTWCGDSKLQVPHFIKIMDALKVDSNSISYIGVDGAKQAENGLLDALKITNVPTFIFTDKQGVEIGRITESPRETLEKDMLQIIAATKK